MSYDSDRKEWLRRSSNFMPCCSVIAFLSTLYKNFLWVKGMVTWNVGTWPEPVYCYCSQKPRTSTVAERSFAVGTLAEVRLHIVMLKDSCRIYMCILQLSDAMHKLANQMQQVLF